MNKNDPFESFLQAFPDSTQILMRQIRELIQSCAPEAKESMKYGIPTFELYGNLVHFSAYKKHIGFYPGPSGISAFADEIKQYKNAKGSVQFPLSEPIPFELIRRITLFRLEENLNKARKPL